MSTLDKLLERLRRNPRDVRWQELERALLGAGYQLVRSAGSHHVFRPENGVGVSLVIARPHGGRQTVSPDAVRDALAAIESKRALEAESDEP